MAVERKNDPFSVPPALLEVIKPDLKVQPHPDLRAIVCLAKYNSPIQKTIQKLPGAKYDPKVKGYLIKVEQLNDLLRHCQSRSIPFAVVESLGEQLKGTAEKRAALFGSPRGADCQTLEQCYLAPILDWTNHGPRLHQIERELFRQLLPNAKYSRDQIVLTETECGELLLAAAICGTRLWLTENFYNQIDAAKSAAVSGAEFPQLRIVQLASTAPILVSIHHRLVLLISKQTLKQAISKPSLLGLKSPSAASWLFPNHLIYSISNARALSLLPRLEQSLVAANSKLIISTEAHGHIAKLTARQELIALRDRYQSMPDIAIDQIELSDKELLKRLFPHQRVALGWLKHHKAAFIGDDMGLGKTLTVLAHYAQLKEHNEADLLIVICPTSLTRNWLREQTHWFPKWHSLLPASTKGFREEQLTEIIHSDNYDLLVLNYESARIDSVLPLLCQIASGRRTLLCLDESQRVKNSQSQTFKALKKLAPLCHYRLLLSGTPTPKDISDIWAQLFLLDQGERLGKDFYRWLAQVAELGNRYSEFAVKRFIPEEVEETVLQVREILLRRRKDEVIQLPEKFFSTRDIELKGEQRERYEEIREQLLIRLTSLKGDSYHREIRSVLEEYLRAVQVASNPRLIDPLWKGEPAKFLELDEIVSEVVTEQQQKIVIWTNYLKNTEELCVRYQKLGIAPFSGMVSPSDRAEIIQKFQDPANPLRILVALPAAGGVGITLTAAQTAVYLDRTWNAEHWLQSIDRIHRIGQRGCVNIIALNGCPIDELIERNLRKKERAQARLLGDDQDGSNWPSANELLQAVAR